MLRPNANHSSFVQAQRVVCVQANPPGTKKAPQSGALKGSLNSDEFEETRGDNCVGERLCAVSHVLD